MPVGGVEVFDGFQFKSGGVDVVLDGGKFFVRPDLTWVTGQAPA